VNETLGVTSVPSGREVLADRDVRILLGSYTLISLGVALQAAVLGKQIFDITGRSIDLAWLGLAEFAPAPVLVLLTGSLADRFNRKKIAGLGLTGEFLCAVGLMLYSLSNPTAVWPFFAIAITFGVFRAFTNPSIRALPQMVAPDGALPRVIALFSATWTGAIIVGPALSGWLYSIDTWVPYAVVSTAIFVGLVWLLSLRFKRGPIAPTVDDKPTLRSAVEGLRFIRHTPIVLGAITLDLFAVLFGGAVALLPVIAKDRLHVGDVAYGWLRAAGGMGAASMAIFLSIRPLRRYVGRMLLFAVGVFGAATIVLGLTHSYVVAFLALITLAGADMVSVFVRGSLIPLVTPGEKLGRVFAVENVFIGASNELGAFESGMAAQYLGLPFAVIGGGIATIAIVGLCAVVFPPLRDIDKFEDLEPASGEPAPS
jgi:MFS family permease